LELEEELEDELNRLYLNSDDDSSETSHDEPREDNNSQSEPSVNNEKPPNKNCESHNNAENVINDSTTNSNQIPVSKEPVRRKSVIFANVDNSKVPEPLYLNFKHSPTEPTPETQKGIMSPSDIYKNYISNFSSKPVSILKVKKNPNEWLETVAVEFKEQEEKEASVVSSGFEIADVRDRKDFVEESVKKPTRKVSKFKASRMKK